MNATVHRRPGVPGPWNDVCLKALGMAAAVCLLGCQPPEIDFEAMAAKQRARPSELNQLDFLVGKWSSTTQATMPGSEEVMRGSCDSETSWGVNKRYLVTKFDADLGGDMGGMAGLEIWTWDPSINRYRTWWFDDWGVTGEGTAWYEPKGAVWRIEASMYNTVEGQKTTAKGTMRVVDRDTIEWTWAEYDALGLIKYYEMNGTQTRQ